MSGIKGFVVFNMVSMLLHIICIYCIYVHIFHTTSCRYILTLCFSNLVRILNNFCLQRVSNSIFFTININIFKIGYQQKLTINSVYMRYNIFSIFRLLSAVVYNIIHENTVPKYIYIFICFNRWINMHGLQKKKND